LCIFLSIIAWFQHHRKQAYVNKEMMLGEKVAPFLHRQREAAMATVFSVAIALDSQLERMWLHSAEATDPLLRDSTKKHRHRVPRHYS
jgi:hypothetical protein